MNSNWFLPIGLSLNFIGALLMAFDVTIKHGKEHRGGREERFITIGKKKHLLKIGAILLAIGFVFQVFGLPLKSMF